MFIIRRYLTKTFWLLFDFSWLYNSIQYLIYHLIRYLIHHLIHHWAIIFDSTHWISVFRSQDIFENFTVIWLLFAYDFITYFITSSLFSCFVWLNQLNFRTTAFDCVVKMLRDLRLHARSLALHVAATIARAEVRAQIQNWLTWCQESSRAIGCVMAQSKTRPARGEPTEQNSTRGWGDLDRSVDSARSAWHQMKLIRMRCGVQSGPSPLAERFSVWLKWKF